MSSRLQILVPEELDRKVRRAAQRRRLSTSAWVRGLIEQALTDDRGPDDALEALANLDGPTGDLEQMLAEIESGRGA